MTDREELLYRIARALDHSREASEMQEATDQAHATPDNAAQLHWDAAGLLEGVLVRVKAIHDQHVFQAKRMEREARIEQVTGIEFRAGDGAA